MKSKATMTIGCMAVLLVLMFNLGIRAQQDAGVSPMQRVGVVSVMAVIQQCQGRVMLSGYPNELYDRTLGDWNRHDREIDNKVSGGASKRVMKESIWCNF